MKGITTIAALPGSGSGCMSALPAEVQTRPERGLRLEEKTRWYSSVVDHAYAQAVVMGMGAYMVSHKGDTFAFSEIQDALWLPSEPAPTPADRQGFNPLDHEQTR